MDVGADEDVDVDEVSRDFAASATASAVLAATVATSGESPVEIADSAEVVISNRWSSKFGCSTLAELVATDEVSVASVSPWSRRTVV